MCIRKITSKYVWQVSQCIADTELAELEESTSDFIWYIHAMYVLASGKGWILFVGVQKKGSFTTISPFYTKREALPGLLPEQWTDMLFY